MTDINVICVYNSKELYDNMTQSFKDTVPDERTYKFIPLDNRENMFSSAAQAYNYAIDNLCDGECLIFCHQDIVFYDGAIENIYNHCILNDNVLYGAAGVKSREDPVYNGIVSTIHQNTKGSRYNNLKSDEADVFTLDECLIAAHRNVFERIRFDEKTCNGWHLYAADFCLQCLLNDIKVKVIDTNILHLSGGNVDKGFYKTLFKMAGKYKDNYDIVNTTWSWAYTNPIKSRLQYIYRTVRYNH